MGTRTTGNRLVIQIQKALWRKLEPLFSHDKKALRFKRGLRKYSCVRGSCRPETKTTVNRYVFHDLSVAYESHLFSENVGPVPEHNLPGRGKKRIGTSSILA